MWWLQFLAKFTQQLYGPLRTLISLPQVSILIRHYKTSSWLKKMVTEGNFGSEAI
jgi:hypothetical protein